MRHASSAREQIVLQAQLLDEVDAAVMLLDFSGDTLWCATGERFTSRSPA